MRMYDIILKKRNGGELTREEIDFFIKGYTEGSIPDYQAASLLMAIYFRGMNKRETADLTLSMVDSGSRLDLSEIQGIKVDKHSTGGVGDKTTLVLAPMVAAAGVPVAKMSGRGLGHTGGTLDKLESIEGFQVQLPIKEFIDNVNRFKISVCGQTENMVPADKKLYALRDVTATVDNISLIAASIMSKKIASGTNAIVLDVKVGSGAFMKNIEDAFTLGKEMVDIGISLNRNVVALITEMNEPLGAAIGNALEVKEAVETLQGNGPKDLLELCIELGATMLVLGNRTESIDEAQNILRGIVNSGAALRKFEDMVKAQHGNVEQIKNLQLLPKADNIIEVKSCNSGYVESIDAESIGISALLLGAGRETKEAGIDHAVGIVLNKKVGDYVRIGETIAFLHANKMDRIEDSKKILLSAYRYNSEKQEKRPLIFGIIDKNGSKKLY